MGYVRTKTMKKSSRQVIERYYSRMTLDSHTNKNILEEVAIIPSKRLRNKIVGPVRGISLKLQEEEHERHMNFVHEESSIKTDRDRRMDLDTTQLSNSDYSLYPLSISIQNSEYSSFFIYVSINRSHPSNRTQISLIDPELLLFSF
ncbi:hypothetical protein MKW92_017380 [Papaver armeniacum]|nr:hypothetical protein MKW92_017380 [Papaver armeniacum]